MAEESLPRGATPPATARSHVSRAAALAADWALPLAIVLYFLHIDFRPKITHGLVTVDVADAAMLLLVLTALAAIRRDGAGILLRSRRLWLVFAAFLAFGLAACFYPLVNDPAYYWQKHLVSWAKLVEFALVAPSATVLLQRRGAVERLLRVLVGLAAAAGAVGIAQFAGLHVLHSWPSGGRQPSFTGIDELGALGGAALAVGFCGVLDSDVVERRLVRPAFVAGIVCVVFSGAVAAGIGVAGAAGLALVLGLLRSRLHRVSGVAIVASVAVCGLGLLALRGGDIAQFARYVGLAKKQHQTNANVQTYSQRLLLLYVGVKVWEDHPLLGAGWSSIRQHEVYAPHLAEAHRRFPDQPAEAFPSPAHPWGIDNAYVALLAEVGLVGLGLFAALMLTGVWTGFRAALRAPPAAGELAELGLLWLVVLLGVWIGQGLTISAFTNTAWLGLGLIALGFAALERRSVTVSGR